MKIETVDIESLLPDSNNARDHFPRNKKTIKASLERFGQVEPLVVQRSTGKVIGGNGRLLVMRELGWTKVGIVKVDLDDASATKLGVALNRSAELAVWNEPVLADILKKVGPEDYELIGFNSDEIKELLLKDNFEFQHPPVPEVEPVPEGQEKLARSLLQYTIVFDNDHQAEAFTNFLKKLKRRYKGEATIGARVYRHIADIEEGTT